jgi:hypothetical protein
MAVSLDAERREAAKTFFTKSAFSKRREERMNNGHDATACSTTFVTRDPSLTDADLTGLIEDSKTFTDPPTVSRKGRIVKVRSLNSDTADALQRALCEPGVLAVLDVVGRVCDLEPADRRLALMLLGEDL